MKSIASRVWRSLERYGVGVPILLGLVLSGGLALAFAIGSGFQDPDETPAGVIDDYDVGRPIYFEIDRFWIVRLEGDDILALNAENPQSRCPTLWYVNEEFMGSAGWFTEPCQGHFYDYSGRCFDSTCTRGLNRFEVTVTDDREIFVNLSVPILGPDYDPDDVPVARPQP